MFKKITLAALVYFGSYAIAFASNDSYSGNQSPQLPPPPHSTHSYFDWGMGNNGWGYCYEFAYNGAVLNAGRPVANQLCEMTRASRVDWGRGVDGWGYCFQWTPYGVPMNEGRSIDNFSCERVNPSFYRWAQGNNGYTYCFQFTAYGDVMNKGRSVPNHYCGR